jgi:hypothetical protein
MGIFLSVKFGVFYFRTEGPVKPNPSKNRKFTRAIQLRARTEMKKTSLFTKQKSEGVAGTTQEFFCEEKRVGFFIESRGQLNCPG